MNKLWIFEIAILAIFMIAPSIAMPVNEILGDTYKVSFDAPDGFEVYVDDPIEFETGSGGYFRDLEMTAKMENKTIGLAIAENTPSKIYGLDHRMSGIEGMGYADIHEITVDGNPAAIGTIYGETGNAVNVDYDIDYGDKSIEVIINAFYLSNEEMDKLLESLHIEEI